MRHYPPVPRKPSQLTGNGVLGRGIKGDIQSFPVHQLKKEDQQIYCLSRKCKYFFQFKSTHIKKILKPRVLTISICLNDILFSINRVMI